MNEINKLVLDYFTDKITKSLVLALAFLIGGNIAGALYFKDFGIIKLCSAIGIFFMFIAINHLITYKGSRYTVVLSTLIDYQCDKKFIQIKKTVYTVSFRCENGNILSYDYNYRHKNLWIDAEYILIFKGENNTSLKYYDLYSFLRLDRKVCDESD